MSAEQVLAGLRRRVWELVAWRNRAAWDLDAWTLRGPGGEARALRLGERWDDLGWPATLATELPEAPPAGALLELALGGQGLVRLDGVPTGGVDLYHREIPLRGARQIAVEAVPQGLFGVRNLAPTLALARVVVPDQELRALHTDLEVTLAAAREFDGHEVVPLLVAALEETLALLRFPSGSDAVQARFREQMRELEATVASERYLEAPDATDILLIHPLQELGGPASSVSDAPLAGVAEAREHLRRRLAEVATRYPPVGRLAVCGHAHIDLAWLWPLAETRRKARRSAATVLSLMERYPDFSFAQSSAQLYAFIQEDDSALFERIRERVREGRWEAVGGSWVEPDANLTGGESLVRQLLYGQRYFKREFGVRSSVAWLPDTFGFTPALPQILAGAGLTRFFTQKLTWSETNRFPYDLWLWEGLDGTRVVAHAFENPVGGYNGRVEPRALLATWRNFRGKTRHPESLFTFGYGDGGGGPTVEMLERIERLQEFPALPRLAHTTIEAFFDRLPTEGLPVWVGELYLELHRGTYTSQGRIKRLHRAAEHRLYEAEAAATLASLAGTTYPRKFLDQAWTTLLRNQFHDILPGSSIRAVNEEAERELAVTVKRAEEIRNAALTYLAGQIASSVGANGGIAVFNLHGEPRPLSCRVSLPDVEEPFRLLSPDGREVPYQRLSDEEVLIHAPALMVPGLGYLVLAIVPNPGHPEERRIRTHRVVPAPEAGSFASLRMTGEETGDTDVITLESDVLRVVLGPDGTLASVYDKRQGREVLDGPGNQLWAYQDAPPMWDAWDIDAGYAPLGEPVQEVEAWRVIDDGPLAACVEVARRYRGSRIVQRYRLRAGSARLDIETEIDWQERGVLLRALFPLAVRAFEATYETAYGAVARPTHRNTSWDAARFEVPGHRWADLSEAGFGVSLLNDGRYGHSAHGNVLGLSLLRSPLSPDPHADAGRHRFTYALLPHAGDWRSGETLREALDLNSPLLALPLDGAVSDPALPASAFTIAGLTLGALKRAEDADEIVLRLYDPYGGRGVAEITPAFPVKRAALVNLLEEEIEPLPIEPGAPIRVPYRPWRIVTLRLAVGQE